MSFEPLVQEFASRGVVRLTRVFSDEDANVMQGVVWDSLRQRDGVDRDDRATWPTEPQWKTLTAAKRLVFVCHPWTIHCRPPNASNGPRFLRAPTMSADR